MPWALKNSLGLWQTQKVRIMYILSFPELFGLMGFMNYCVANEFNINFSSSEFHVCQF